MRFSRFGVVLAVLIFALGIIPAASASPIGVFNTGVDDSGALLVAGSVDPHYTLTQSADPSFPGPAAMVVSDSGYPFPDWWSTNGPNSKWIAPSANEALPNTVGMYTFEVAFDLTGLDLSSAVITGRWVSDNNGVDILINGISTGFTNSGWFYDTSGFSAFTISSGFVTGLNTLDFVVYNVPGGSLNPIGLRVEMSGTANPSPVPEPSTLLLLGSGLAGLGGMAWRRHRRG